MARALNRPWAARTVAAMRTKMLVLLNLGASIISLACTNAAAGGLSAAAHGSKVVAAGVGRRLAHLASL
jgi:hypothetical protein